MSTSKPERSGSEKRVRSVQSETFKTDPGKYVRLATEGTPVRVVVGPGKNAVVLSVAREPKPIPTE
jgi:hypothetical protein